MPLRYVVLDFDGTCTRVQDTAQGYMDMYRDLLAREVASELVDGWDEAVHLVRARSPEAGWTLAVTPSAPIAADPYILSGEVAGYLERRHRARRGPLPRPIPADLYRRAYHANEAPWRDEVPEVLERLVGRGLEVCFVSNSSTATIEARLDALLGARSSLRSQIQVFGDAGKFKIQELSLDPGGPDAPLPTEAQRSAFHALDAAVSADGLGRPIYLRRGAYFEALCRVWGSDPHGPATTMVCGDIWELDLAMPARLGSHVHLIARAAPYETCEYERDQVARLGERGAISDDLRGLVERIAG